MNITARMNFDCDLDNSSSTDYDIYKAYSDYLEYGGSPALGAALAPMWLRKWVLGRGEHFQRADRVVKQYIMKVIMEEQDRQQEDSIQSNKPKNLVASLVAAIKEESLLLTKASLTQEEVVDEMTMIGPVGFEPTTAGIAWSIFFLSKNPDVQQRIKDELKEHHLTRNTPITLEILDSLVFVQCFINEVLRFAPIDPFIMRDAIRDDMIGNIPIKKGDVIMIVCPHLHTDPRYWNIDPSKFVPERWLEKDKSPPHCAYMPFGGGHRACIGKDLAILEMKITIVRLMQRVTFEDPGEEANNTGGFKENLNTSPKDVAVRVRID
jgi:cytochrome P450